MKKLNIGFKPGHPGYLSNAQFKKGHQTWNKGKKGIQPWHNTSGLVTDGSLNRGKNMSLEQRIKCRWAARNRTTNKGHTHWNWQGGLAAIQNQVRNMALYRDWRQTVFQRDNYTCVWCGIRGVKINADHIIPFADLLKQHKIKHVHHARLCAELWDISNGRTLCVPCHRLTDTFGNKKRS